MKEIPQEIIKAYQNLKDIGVVNVKTPMKWTDKFKIQLEFEIEICISRNLGKKNIRNIALKVIVPENFPFDSPKFLSMDEEITGFAHQPNNFLCLGETQGTPLDYTKLVYFVEKAKKWLDDAINEQLIKAGDPYELPYFGALTGPQIVFSEDKVSFEKWQSYFGKVGKVQCSWAINRGNVFALEYLDSQKKVICKTGFSSHFKNIDRQFNITWLLLPKIVYEKHRPPKTYQEIKNLCQKYNIDFDEVREDTCKDKQGVAILLIGFPITKTYGEKNTEIHWQPLYLHLSSKACKSDSGLVLPQHATSSSLEWGWSTNVTSERLYSRGALPNTIQESHTSIVGCGAIGSIVAEFMARGGTKKIDLFDYDILLFGNLCRHTLEAMDIGRYKSISLANKLSLINPFSEIKGHVARIPLHSKVPIEVSEGLKNSRFIIDCTANEEASLWLSDFAENNEQKIVVMFFNIHAETLTLIISNKSNSCQSITQDLFDKIKNKKTPVEPKVYFYQPKLEDEIIEGAGCFESTFPALFIHINMLVASAMDLIVAYVNEKPQNGLAVILQRNSRIFSSDTNEMVKITWSQEY
ncbi:ThiF family adenylyltransferase [Candidatus Uabimicrobium sp. HlEnr_7]|uniref:ThiF family adenylyltransferase n=1 Tax=Candidatus Uabimicrobium helgolandensis TaxID=3095367 RepID=UPI003555CB84